MNPKTTIPRVAFAISLCTLILVLAGSYTSSERYRCNNYYGGQFADGVCRINKSAGMPVVDHSALKAITKATEQQ